VGHRAPQCPSARNRILKKKETIVYDTAEDIPPGLHDAKYLRLRSEDPRPTLSVDPGRLAVISSVLRGGPPVPDLPRNANKRSKARRKKQIEEGISTYQLSGQAWRSYRNLSGFDKELQAWRDHGEYSLRDITRVSAKSLTFAGFMDFVLHRHHHRVRIAAERTSNFRKKLRIRRFQQSKRALAQVERELTGGDKGTLILWGKGSVNAPAIKGMPQAPNKTIYMYLVNQGYAVVLANEFRTSQECPTCSDQVLTPQQPWLCNLMFSMNERNE
jgi:hypothetical protein